MQFFLIGIAKMSLFWQLVQGMAVWPAPFSLTVKQLCGLPPLAEPCHVGGGGCMETAAQFDSIDTSVGLALLRAHHRALLDLAISPVKLAIRSLTA